MKPRTLSIGAVLERWVAEFADVGHAKVTSSAQLVTVEFVLPTLDRAFTTREQLAALREALEVLHVAAQLDVGSVEEAVAGLCYSSFADPADDDELDELQAKQQIRTNDGSTRSSESRKVEFVLTFYGTDGRFLEEDVATTLFAPPGPRSEAFVSARNELCEGRAEPMPPIQCRLNIVSMDGGFDEVIEDDYLQRVVSFIQILDEVAVTTDEANQNEAGDGIPVLVKTISLELNEMAVTSETVTAAAALQKTTIPVVCTRVGLNPREVSCGADELSVFLDAVGSRSPKLTVEIGHALMCAPTPSLDADGASQVGLIQTLFQGIAGARSVTGVSFGPLLTMMSSLENRKALWSELFVRLFDEHAMAHATTLVVSPQVELLAEDATFIEEAVSFAPAPRIKSLIMWLTQSSPSAVQSLIRAIGVGATAVTLHSEPHAMTPSQTVDVILRECPNMQRLSLTAAVLDSMSVFASSNSPLRELTLTSVALQDSSSLASFLDKLSDPSTMLAKNLQKLHIKTENNAADHLEVDGASAIVIEQMLANNTVLRDLELSMCDDVPTTSLAKIQAHDKQVLAEPLVLDQKLAFLGAILPRVPSASKLHRCRVDDDAVRLIFEFAAERVLRHVYLEF